MQEQCVVEMQLALSKSNKDWLGVEVKEAGETVPKDNGDQEEIKSPNVEEHISSNNNMLGEEDNDIEKRETRPLSPSSRRFLRFLETEEKIDGERSKREVEAKSRRQYEAKERSRQSSLAKERSRKPSMAEERSRQPSMANERSRKLYMAKERSRQPSRERSQKLSRERSMTKERSRKQSTTRERSVARERSQHESRQTANPKRSQSQMASQERGRKRPREEGSPGSPALRPPFPKIPRLSAAALERRAAERARAGGAGRLHFLYGGRWEGLATILEKERVEQAVPLERFLRRPAEVPRPAREEPAATSSGRQEARQLRRVEDDGERRDIEHQDWREVREAESDKARKELARRTFGNPVFSDPAINLSFHGFRRRAHGRRSPGHDNFSIEEGRCVALTGKRARRESVEEAANPKMVIHISDFGQVMRSRFSESLSAPGGEITQAAVDSFLTFLQHHTAGRRETEDFLLFYAERKVMDDDMAHILFFSLKGAVVEEQQAREILDFEDGFEKFKKLFGENKVDEVWCTTCNKKHKFSL
jgi:hypothetical protein